MLDSNLMFILMLVIWLWFIEINKSNFFNYVENFYYFICVFWREVYIFIKKIYKFLMMYMYIFLIKSVFRNLRLLYINYMVF